MKTIGIKLTKFGENIGPFTIKDNLGNAIASHVPKEDLIAGKAYRVQDAVVAITLTSEGDCFYEKTVMLTTMTNEDLYIPIYQTTITAELWRHLANPRVFNSFYGKTQPYIIEYPFYYNFHDQIVQNIKDYSKVYRYLEDPYEETNEVSRIELNDVWFNKAILYNDQQCSGLLHLIPKPKRSLKSYMGYPKYNSDSKDILFTKSDNFYQYNTFWSVQKDSSQPSFKRSCKSLSIDKELNQENMDYTKRTYRKAPLRAKDLKIRHILDNRSDIAIISQFIVAPSQISYK